MARLSSNKSSVRRKRSDQGTWQKTTRDVDAWWMLAQQKYVRMDTLGEWFAPGYAKVSESPPFREAQPRGGNRQQVPWPSDHRHRMMAVQRIVARWQYRIGVVDTWQPYKDLPAWVRLNQRGLEELHLDWPESDWPEDEKRLRDNSHDRLSHAHRVNKVRFALARGEVPEIPPQHLWLSEREVERTLPARYPGLRLPHKTDGCVILQTDTTWTQVERSGDIEQMWASAWDDHCHRSRIDQQVLPDLSGDHSPRPAPLL